MLVGWLVGSIGSWKKLDVDINFTKKDQVKSNHGQGGTVKKVGGTNNKGSGRSKGDLHKKSTRAGGRHRNGNKKTGDTPETNPNWREKSSSSSSSSSGNKHHHHRRYYHQQQHQHQHQHQQPEVLEQIKTNAVKQIEYFFSMEELVKNVFLRRHMDVDGYLPAAIVFNFPSVAKFGLPYPDLLTAVSQKSTKVDVDFINECLRVHGDYKKWLFPNQDGSYGCPKWLKQVQDTQITNDETTPTSTKEEEAQQQQQQQLHVQMSSEQEKHESKLKDAGSPPDLTMTDSDTDHDSR